MNEKAKAFGEAVNRLIAGKNLDQEESTRLFAQILNNEQSDIHQGAFLAAVTAKGPVPAEIAGAWQAIFDMDTIQAVPEVTKPVVDNCGTGMDGFKTFNNSTGAAIVAAAGGACLARHGARAITSRCGTVDLCEALGVDVECSVDVVKQSIEKADIGLFNGMSPAVHPKALFRILSQIQFGSILNIAASLANPADPRYGVRGVYAEEMVTPVIQVMKAVGFKRAIVFHGRSGNGVGGMDELSPVSDSLVAELNGNGDITHYTLSPDEAGLPGNIRLEDIAGGEKPQKEAIRLLRVLTGHDRAALYETICLNAAPIFMVSDLVDDIRAGVIKARETIDSGKALKKLKQWVSVQNREPETGMERLEMLLSER